MITRFSFVFCLAALALAVTLPGLATAANGDSTDQAPVTLSDEQIAALEDASAQNSGGSSDKSVFEEVSDFVTDNAPYFIIGIVILAAIIAGIFILRGRSGAGSPRGPTDGTGAPSSSEMKRRKRAAIQRSREEERLRRKGGLEGRRSYPGGTAPPVGTAAGAAAVGAAAAGAAGAGSSAGLDPVAAEKQGARDQQQAAAAVARSGGGAIPAPPSPSQTAPSAAVAATAAGVGTSSSQEAGTTYGEVPPQPGPEPDTIVTEPPATSEQTAPEPPPGSEQSAPEPPPAAPEPSPGVPEGGVQVGGAAAALAAGAAGGAIAGRASSSASPPAEPASDEAALEAEARLRAKVDEIKAEQGRSPGSPPSESGLREAEQIERDIDVATPPPGPTPGLSAVERRLSADSEERDRTLREAEERLQRIERRAEDAERRAAFAERLAQLKIEESDRERRLNEVVSGIDRAEERAREAEARAEAAERAAAKALEERDAPRAPAPASGFSEPIQTSTPSGPAFSASSAEGRSSGQTGKGDESPDEANEPQPGAGSDSPSGSGLFSREGEASSTGTGPGSASGALDLNRATFEDLRDADLSVTQATRILAYRERFGGYRSVDDLEKVPGFPDDLIASLRGRITV